VLLRLSLFLSRTIVKSALPWCALFCSFSPTEFPLRAPCLIFFSFGFVFCLCCSDPLASRVFLRKYPFSAIRLHDETPSNAFPWGASFSGCCSVRRASFLLLVFLASIFPLLTSYSRPLGTRFFFFYGNCSSPSSVLPLLFIFFFGIVFSEFETSFSGLKVVHQSISSLLRWSRGAPFRLLLHTKPLQLIY